MNALENLAQAAALLSQLDEPLVYVGGAVAPLYYQRPEYHEHARPTMDVDCVAEVVSYLALQPLQEQVRALGFSEGREPADPICRWRGHGLVIDLVPVDPDVLGFSNPWYAEGWKYQTLAQLDEQSIPILAYGHYLATKMTAFSQRAVDPRTSHDLEDVMLTMAARCSLTQDLEGFPHGVREFLRLQFGGVFRGPHRRDLFAAYLPTGLIEAEERIQRFIAALEQ